MSKLVKNTLLYSLGSILPQAVGFILIPLYTKYLSPSEFGIVNSMLVIQVFLAIFLTFTLEKSILRLYYDYKTEEEKKIFISSIFKGILLCTLITLGFVFVFSNKIQLIFSDIEFYPYYIIAILTSVFMTFNLVPKSYYRLKQNAKKYITLSITEFLLSTGLVIWFIVFKQEGALGMLSGKMYAFLFLLPVYVFIMREFIFTKFDIVMLKNGFSFSLPIVPTMLAAWILGQADRIFIANYFSLNDVGIYAMSQRLASLVTIFSSSFMLSYHPLFFEVANSDEQESAKKKLGRYNHIFILTIMLFSFAIVFFSKELVLIFLNSRYHSAYLYIPVISLSYFIGSVSSIIIGVFYQQSKKMKADMTLGIIGACFTLLTLFIFVKPFGITGAIWAALISSLFIFLSGYIYTKKKCYFIPFKWIPLGKVFSLLCALVIVFNYFLVIGVYFALIIKMISLFIIGVYFYYKYMSELTIIIPFLQKRKKTQ